MYRLYTIPPSERCRTPFEGFHLQVLHKYLERPFIVPLFLYNRRDRALTFTGSHFVIGLESTERVGLRVSKPSPAPLVLHARPGQDGHL